MSVFRSRAFLVALSAFAVVACDDPLKPRQPPEMRQLGIFMLLNPDVDTQAVLVLEPLTPRRGPLYGTMRENGVLVGEQTSVEDDPPTVYEACYRLYNPSFPPYMSPRPRCVSPFPRPTAGATYEVSVTAPGLPTARATTTVPGAFSIVSNTIQGEPPNEDVSIDLTWTSSAGAFRYMVTVSGIAPLSGPDVCFLDIDCRERWIVVTEDTTLSAVVASRFFDKSSFPYSVVVYAVNRDLYGYMMTGSTSEYFPVPPEQNVIDGYGSVGAWVKRSVPIPLGLCPQC